jgi:hypothetical protein
VTTLVGADFCDRHDVQAMLKESGSDIVKCIYNPGPQKKIRLSHSCQSSIPSEVIYHLFTSVYGYLGDEYEYIPSGSWPYPSGTYWIIDQHQAFPIPRIRKISNHQETVIPKVSSILFCRALWPHGECRDSPVRGARRIAKIFIDDVEVSKSTLVFHP